jgi:predicted N-formylglutamate amidohydrolase
MTRPDEPLLAAGEPAPFRIHNAGGRAAMLLVCDHASHRVPAALDELGLGPDELRAHIGWDIGAASITEELASHYDAPAVLTSYSRLVVDCNRYPDDPSSMPDTSDGIGVPGNRDLTAAAREARLDALFRPYHAAIASTLDAMEARGSVPVFVSIHSMTPVMRGLERPWPVALSWRHDARLAPALIEALRADGIVTGDNEPYGLDPGDDYTTPEHAMRRGLAHLQVEFRQDIVASRDDAVAWARRFARILDPLLDAPVLAERRHHWP